MVEVIAAEGSEGSKAEGQDVVPVEEGLCASLNLDEGEMASWFDVSGQDGACGAASAPRSENEIQGGAKEEEEEEEEEEGEESIKGDSMDQGNDKDKDEGRAMYIQIKKEKNESSLSAVVSMPTAMSPRCTGLLAISEATPFEGGEEGKQTIGSLTYGHHDEKDQGEESIVFMQAFPMMPEDGGDEKNGVYDATAGASNGLVGWGLAPLI